ncbi:MAG: nitroreductase family protein [Actinomycetia bacterium]|nr:nitroreductase family protein [Actinomycetes bacterium]
MKFDDVVKKRRSIRSYSNKHVDKESIIELIEAARLAPSGANLQPWKFIAITKPEILKKLKNTAKFYVITSNHVAKVPLVIAVLADMVKSNWAVMDCSMASENLMLKATSLGLGTCFIGQFDEREVKKILNIPDNYSVTGLITVGHPDEDPKPPRKLDIKDMLFFDKFGHSSFVKRILEYRKSGPLTVFKKILKMLLRL